jgi:putative PIN family toxin of toxin-antitoxin system
MIKIVLDTNTLIDGSTDDYNYCNRIINEVIAGDVQAYANVSTLRENKLLAQKKILDEGYLKRLKYFFDLVHPVESLRVDVVFDDPEDNKIIGSAIACQADFVITSDHHLLKLEKVKGVDIVSPAQFWQRYEDQGDTGWRRWLGDFVK